MQLTERCNTAVARDSFVGLDVTIYNSDLHPGRKKASCVVLFVRCVSSEENHLVIGPTERETFTVGAATSLREHHDCYSQLRRGVFHDALLLFRE